MNRTMHLLSAVLTIATGFALLPVGSGLVQAAPPISQLTPLQRQQIERDLVPSGAQDFFNKGRGTLEHEIRLLTEPRSPLNEPLLTIRKSSQTQSSQILLNERVERPEVLHHHLVK